MTPVRDQQLERLVDGAIKSSNFEALHDFLQEDIGERSAMTCSKQFLIKLDKLITRGLDDEEAKQACLGLTILHKCGKSLSISGRQGLSEFVAQGLVKKMVQWFEKCRQLWIKGGPQRNQPLLNLAEDFFDLLMVVREVNKEGMYQVTESLLYPTGQLAADPRIYIMIQKEAIRKLNDILDKIPTQLKEEKMILSSQEASDIMVKLAGQILDGGDFDLQNSLTEALCRMSVPGQRKELADRWFTMEYVASAFSKIHDSTFETDSRRFLNLVNGMQGDKRRVHSYPCLEAFLEEHELLMPSDENLEEFWIDFNLGSQSISFYFSVADEEVQDGVWDTICISENEVKSYTVTEEAKRRVLRLQLSEAVCVGVLEGTHITIHFSSSLDVLQAVHRVYGHSKNKSLVAKSGTSVVKTIVKSVVDNSCSQPVVPESQVSSTADTEKERSSAFQWLPPPPAPLQVVTPARRRVSESISVIRSAEGSVYGASPKPASTPNRGKVKPALEMIRSCEKQGQQRTSTKTSSNSTKTDSRGDQIKDLKQNMGNMTERYRRNIPVDKVVEMLQAGQEEEPQLLDRSFVPDSQPNVKTERSIFTVKHSVCEMPVTERNGSLTRPGSGPICHKKLHIELQHLQDERNQQERNQTPRPQALAGPLEKRPEDREVSQARGSVDRCRTTGPGPKEPQQQPAGRQDRGRTQEPVRAPTNILRERTTPNPTVKATGTLSSKEKRDAVVAGMVKPISNQTSNTNADENTPSCRAPPLVKRSLFDGSWLPSAKKDAIKTPGFMKCYSNPRKSLNSYKEDVFAFNLDISKSSGKGKKSTESSAIDSSGIRDSWLLPSATKKGQPVAKAKRHVKEHLFSDTDTDAVTEISWLRESSRKNKPKVTDYTRRAPAPRTAHGSPNVKEKAMPNKRKPRVEEMVEKPVKAAASSRPAGRRPRRAAAVMTKSYRDPDSQSETEHPPVFKGKSGQIFKEVTEVRRKKTAPNTCREPDIDSHESQSETEQPPTPKKHVMGQQKEREICRDSNEAKERKTAATKQPTKSSKELECDSCDSQSETEQPPAPKKHVMNQQGKSGRICKEVTEVRRKKTAPNTCRELDIDSHESQSEMEQPAAPKKHVMGQQERSEKICQEVAELKKKRTAPTQHPTKPERCPVQQQKSQKTHQAATELNKKMTLARKQSCGQEASWTSRLAALSPPPVEWMRTAKDLLPNPVQPVTPLGSPLSTSPVPCCQDPPSPIPELPKPLRSSVASHKGGSPPFYRKGRKSNVSKAPSPLSPTSKVQPPVSCRTKRPSVTELSPILRPLSPAARSPLSQSSPLSRFNRHGSTFPPQLTSTAAEPEMSLLTSLPQPQFSQATLDTLDSGLHYGSSKESLVSRSSTRSEVLSGHVEANPALALADQLEVTPCDRANQQPYFVSGPTRKRHSTQPSLNNSEEEEKEGGRKRRARLAHKMRPRKLFKSSTMLDAEAHSWGDQSSSDEENGGSGPTDAISGRRDIRRNGTSTATRDRVVVASPEGEVRRVVSEVSVELQRRFQSRSRRLELFTRQSLRTVQQHVSSMSLQVSKHRTHRLDLMQSVLLEEINTLDHDTTMVKSMEKELTMYWRRQSTACHTYQEKEARRLEKLKSAFQDSAPYNQEANNTLMNSQMGLMRKDLKSVQDKLLKETHEEELQNVRKGLQALFLP